jgi:aspartyl-tRNA(Asn)/glutamyl-tRNA(Gln) amidotransferase subunit B
MPASDYLVTIGLEVHCQLTTASKMFCACPATYGAEVNTLTCPVCLGLPGALPVLNQGAIERTILAGAMLGCTTPPVVVWDRKNYFYPDMPKNYQTTQLDFPLCLGGAVTLSELAYPKDWQKKIVRPNHVIRVTRIHLEEDVAKSTHVGTHSAIDFNRAGTPLMEIVSEPEIETPEEAVAYLNSLRQILVYSGVGDADMEKGQMRCDVNISLRPPGTAKLGAKVELKNLNSTSAVRRSIYFEIERQASELDRGIAQIQSTRRWDDERGESSIMRTKEDAHDYRYFPCPDLVPLHTAEMVARVTKVLPELPQAKRTRFETDYSVSPYDAGVLTSEKSLADYFETAAAGATKPKVIANWILNDLLGHLSAHDLAWSQNPIDARALRELADIVAAGQINGPQAKEVLAAMFTTRDAPATIIAAKGLMQVSDSGFLDEIIARVLAENADAVAKIKAGNDKPLNALKGQVMKLSQGKANPQVVGELLAARLASA